MVRRTGDGSSQNLGLTFKDGKANFAIYSSRAKNVSLCLYGKDSKIGAEEIPLSGPHEGIWHVEVEDLPLGSSYGFRIEGKESHALVADPYATMIDTSWKWGGNSHPLPPYRCKVLKPAPFDWQGVKRPEIPLQDLVIYEMHVRGFTRDPSSNTSSAGTYLGVIEKIPYLKKLGVNAVELMPIFEFDETHTHPLTNEPMLNYWGYSPISFFMPMSRYATSHDRAIDEFKTMVRELHRNGIEVILDVVYNHTGEDNHYVVSFRGIDRPTYYMLDNAGNDLNFSGCGNTFRVHSEAGQRIILDSLHYWVQEMGVDGFRFDLAAILTRGFEGAPLPDPPILRAMAKDPILKPIKLIAEPWDAAGLYQLNKFASWGNWSAWNGKYRDHVRRFIKGTDGEAGAFAAALSGCEACYGGHSPLSSINFITAHDGFSLCDLVSYQDKHNEANGEYNRDGTNQNESWNCGAEGPTEDKSIQELRERQMRNFLLALFVSQGIPMLSMGDEYGHTRKGNNNPYTQDNEINWFDWKAAGSAKQGFTAALIAFRKRHALLRSTAFLTPEQIEWHGHTPLAPSWNSDVRFVAFTLKGAPSLYVAFNADYRNASVTLPKGNWRLVVNTKDGWNHHHFDKPNQSITHADMPPYSALIAES